jgi:putative nucleotidyltransferase with HDIG domain
MARVEALLKSTPALLTRTPGSVSRLLDRLAAGLDASVPGTDAHCRRVARYAAGTGKRMCLSREQMELVRRAAVLHDIGKFETPIEIINKRGPLSREEFALVEQHSAAGAKLVAGLGDEALTAIVRHHHERFDGDGYPDGLAGKAIPLGARIVAVADTFDAVTSTRPYRPAIRRREALELLEAEAGTQLDPDVVSAFRAYYRGVGPALARTFAR